MTLGAQRMPLMTHMILPSKLLSVLAAVAAFIFLLSHAFAASKTINGRVVAILDGDTLVMLTTADERHKIRLSEIDAPEKDQPFGSEAAKMLVELAGNKDCTATVSTIDRYGRNIARLDCNGVHVNRRMVQQGGAWVYSAYPHTKEIELEEVNAARSGAGLWSLPEAHRVPPWRWRRGDKTPSASTAAPTFTCDSSKLFCSQMSSCEEATYYLKNCGRKNFDGDRDGRACESQCRQ